MNARSVITYAEPRELAVSIIIPMRNEERYIAACLDSVLANDFPRDEYEIIVMDGRSTDRSCQIVQRYVDQYPFIKLLDNPGEIVPTGLNIAIRNARGRYILRMDAHSEYPNDYVRSCVSEIERTGAQVVGGGMTTKPGSKTLMAQAIALMSTHKFGVGNSAFRIGLSDRYVDTVPFGAFRREVFEEVGLFRERLRRHQDFEMASRIRSAGGKIFLSSKIHLTYYNVPTLAKFLHQALLNGIWVGRTWVCYPSTIALRKVVPVLFTATILACAVAGVFFPPGRVLLGVALGAYAVAALVSAAQISHRNGWRFMLVMPWLFFAYHFLFGVTSFAGLATFYRGKDSQRVTPPDDFRPERSSLSLVAGRGGRTKLQDTGHELTGGRTRRRKVLLIAYYYPPRRQSGAVRPFGLAKYFSALGWEPVILTPREPGRNSMGVIETDYVDILAQWKRRLGFHPEKALREQLNLSAPSMEDVRSGRKDLIAMLKWMLTYPDSQRGWYPFAVREIATLRDTCEFDAIISTGPPLVTHMVAAKAKEILNCPWIADFRDLWNIDETFQERRGAVGALQRRTERNLLFMADALVTVSEPWAQELRRRHPRKRVEAITNGFDPDEVRVEEHPLTKKFSITHTGILYEGLRDPSALLEVLNGLVRSGRVDRSDLLLRFYGSKERFLSQLLKQHDLDEVSQVCGSVPRGEALRIQRDSQLLLALSWGSNKGRNNPEAGLHTGKIFEYLAARRPILALGGVRGVLTELLEETNAGIHVLSEEQLRVAILDRYREYKQTGRVAYHGNPVAIDKYSHPNMARKFARLLDSVVSTRAQAQGQTVTASVQQAC